jgi:hypothetical protein
MAVTFVKHWMNSKAMAGRFCVSEYFAGNPQNLFWLDGGGDRWPLSGRHPDIRTDREGRATFTGPANAFGSGQSYLCFSRSRQGGAPAFHLRSTIQTFFGATDLDIGPVRDGGATVGRVWAAAETQIAAEFRGQLAPRPQGASIVVELVDPAGGAPASARVGSMGTIELASTARQSGWHSFKTTASGLPPGGLPFELSVTYTATQELSPR